MSHVRLDPATDPVHDRTHEEAQNSTGYCGDEHHTCNLRQSRCDTAWAKSVNCLTQKRRNGTRARRRNDHHYQSNRNLSAVGVVIWE